jgi:flagellar hook-length control protein FliK
MIGTATRPPPVLAAAPTPTPADKLPQAGTSAHPFAEMLRQNRLADAPAANQPPKASTTADAKSRPETAGAEDGAEATAPNPSLSRRDAAQSKARSGGASQAPARPTPTRTAATTEKTSATTEEDGAPTTASVDATASANPAVAKGADLATRTDAPLGEQTSGAASIAGTSAAASVARGLGSADNAQAADAIAPGGTAQGKAAAAGTESRRDAVASIADAASHAGTKASEVAAHDAASASFTEALAESKTSLHAGAPSPVGDLSRAGAAATAALAEPMRQLASPAEAAVATATVPVPVDSPDFAAAFGMQVGSLARDGIQRAELHLNPTEMGPVSIQITLDGTQARVDFGADVAATRQAIEAGLPELASALRDAGFTLAGGGVTQHSGSNGGRADDAGSRHGGSRRGSPEVVARLDAAAQRAMRRSAAGGVDLYA